MFQDRTGQDRGGGSLAEHSQQAKLNAPGSAAQGRGNVWAGAGPGETTQPPPSGRETRKTNRHRCTVAANVMRYDPVRFHYKTLSAEAAHPAELATLTKVL